MLNVCGITFDHTTNYGSCMQSYALKEAIEQIEVFGEKCRYELIPIRTFKEFPGKDSFLANWQRSQFKRFERKHIKYANISTLADLKSLNNIFDAFVCGSDVIWNPDFNYGWDAFYLGFAEKYKFSYAASFGKLAIDNKHYDLIRNNLKSFCNISVRENSGVNLVKELTGKKAVLVSDPVILLNKDKWMKVAAKPKKKNGKYIFVYTTHNNEVISSFIENLKAETGLKVINSIWGRGPVHGIRNGKLQVQSPERWLQQLKDAEYVVTNSFHATVFSILFHKKFYTVVQGERDKGINIRMNDFLTSLGIEDRMITAKNKTLESINLDYFNIDKKLDEFRKASKDYLKANLEAAYKRKHNNV